MPILTVFGNKRVTHLWRYWSIFC